LAIGTWATGRANAAIIDLTATDNATVNRGAPTADQSETQTIQTKRLNDSNTRLSYLRFALPVGLNENDITSATLVLKFTNNSTIATPATDTVRAFALLDGAVNTGTGGTSETTWNNTIVWDTQPAGAVAQATSGLPNTNTTASLGQTTVSLSNTNPPTATPQLLSITLNLATFQTLIANDTNDQVTLLFHNLQNTILSFASITNTNSHEFPTLRLDVVPEPGSAALLLVGSSLVTLRRRHRGA
jgi:hypothetical protein